MKIKIVFDFHDIFVDSVSAWKKAFYECTKDKNVKKLYDLKTSKKDICEKYNLNYISVENRYRQLLGPINKNIIFLKNISKVYEITVVSMSRKERLLKDINKFDLGEYISEVYSKEDVGNYSRSKFLMDLGKNYDWLLFFNHEYDYIKISNNIIYFPIDFQGDINQFNEKSFTEHAKTKLIYNELSDIYMDSIANDTEKETTFLDLIFKNENKISNILDCCCGVGRHCKGLSDKGYKVTGIDISKKQIENAKKINGTQNVEYYQMDVRNIDLGLKKFDAAICMWTTYNYLSLDNDLMKFIKGVHKHIKKDGLFVLDSKNIPSLQKNRVYKRKRKNDKVDLELLVVKRIVENIQNSQYFYFLNRNSKNEFYMDEEFVRFYNLNELKNFTKDYFEVVGVYGEFDRSNYNEKSSNRFIVVLKKK